MAGYKMTVKVAMTESCWPVPIKRILRRSDRKRIEGIYYVEWIWLIWFLALCTTPSEERTVAKVLKNRKLSINRVYQAVQVFRKIIMRLMPQEDLGKRRGRSERTKTLDVIQKVDIVYMYFFKFLPQLRWYSGRDTCMCCCLCWCKPRRPRTRSWDVSFFFTELLTITDSYVLGFWADPEKESSGDEDEEENRCA